MALRALSPGAGAQHASDPMFPTSFGHESDLPGGDLMIQLPSILTRFTVTAPRATEGESM